MLDDKLYLLELAGSEMRRLAEVISKRPYDEALAQLREELAIAEPYGGIVIEVPDDAVEHVKITSGSRRALPLDVVVVSATAMFNRREPAIERNVAYVARAISAVRANGAISELVTQLIEASDRLTEARNAEDCIALAHAEIAICQGAIDRANERLARISP